MDTVETTHGFSPPIIDARERDEAVAAATEIAADAAARVDDAGEFEAVGLVGDPAEQLLDYSAAHDAEYIVVSGRKRSPLNRALFGSVTQALLLNADRPVVAVPHEQGQDHE